jgi:putative membrane protein
MENTYTADYGLKPQLSKNDKTARALIWTASIIVFIAVAMLAKLRLNVSLPFNPHVFATINAVVNSLVTICLVAALIAVKKGNYLLHKKIMVVAIFLSVLFLLSYIGHHLLAGETKYGDLNHDGIVSEAEKAAAGTMRIVYLLLLSVHIPLAAIILPFILFTAYRALTGDYQRHKKLSRITWPIWLFVAVSGVIIYLMIRPYYV